MRAMTKQQQAALRAVLRDVVFLAGCASLLYGVWQIYRPAAFIVGALLAITGVFLHVRGQPDD